MEPQPERPLPQTDSSRDKGPLDGVRFRELGELGIDTTKAQLPRGARYVRTPLAEGHDVQGELDTLFSPEADKS